ncbi:transthyretin-like family domain-containing protein [Ditylenchus destructor]|uniref:Transthyretin-like family domain-containing protein n=1 Tax=Ditylenchus destructor TaxID=166010 RepID=A0AAD4R6J5_9BILA|nr:transthyretin-like family domain-containing protein [Ditylenchus destructor]
MVRLISLAFCLLLIVCVEGMRKQGVAIKGRLKCGHFPAQSNSTRVRIVDIDTGPDPDDTLDEKFVDRNGDFKLNGYTRELTNIDPVLYVWTDCNDAGTPCHRKITFKIPQKFIVGEPKPEEWVDIGQINLQSVFEDENRDCIF